jgi:predicted dithiol-disulfide oxidoreductase (DUF899 family)
MAHAKPPIVSAAEWETALASLATQEEVVAVELDRLAAARKRMPLVRVEGDYRFEGPHGEMSLGDLFEGRSQLILYRFFFEEGVEGWPDAGCVGYSSWADGVADLNLLRARDITFAMASPAPQPSLSAYAERMGWTDLPWYTIKSPSFIEDFGAQEWFALNIFLRDREEVYRTYFLQNGTVVSHIGSVTSMAALTPYGGQFEGEEVPDGWPQETFSYWMRRHDEFDEPAPSARN